MPKRQRPATQRPRGKRSIRGLRGAVKRRVLEAIERRPLVLQRMIDGVPVGEIARELDVDRKTIWRDYTAVMDEAAELEQDRAKHRKALEDRRLDRLLHALKKKIEKGDVKAARVALQISQRRARLHGLDAPTKVEATGKDGQPLIPLDLVRAVLGEGKGAA